MNRIKAEYSVVLAGNPNVGKSTLFNVMTGLHQHTGNWAGKTVEIASGYMKYNENRYKITDLPGTYSLTAKSKEEEIAGDYLCFNPIDVTIVVCDATCLERNLILALQILQITSRVIICINLIDQAKRNGIVINTKALEELLGVPVVCTQARKKGSLKELYRIIETICESDIPPKGFNLKFTKNIETQLDAIRGNTPFTKRWYALKALQGDCDFFERASQLSPECDFAAFQEAAANYAGYNYYDTVTSCTVITAEGISANTVSSSPHKHNDAVIDKILTGKFTAVPIMLLGLFAILWITVSGANYPSALLSDFFVGSEAVLSKVLLDINVPHLIVSLLCEGIYRVVGWVISVMLPPMAIFFPLFALLEDSGILPRIAFNLDGCFKKAGACGKQSLSLCMSLGCNACGVIGARIIDSKRERFIAILTSSLVPCNGKFPTIISLFTIFFSAFAIFSGNLTAALGLSAVLILGIAATFFISKILSATILKGQPSSFTIELPPYRMPQIIKTLIRSFTEKTFYVLIRAITVAAPAGLVIWIMANTTINDISLLNYCTDFFDPMGRLMGLDGVILFSFILGFPANEIVIPLIIMAYSAGSSLTEITQLDMLKELLISNGWSPVTAVCVIIFCLFHFPCSTTCITIYKETKSIKWTLIGMVIPTLLGICLCIAVNFIAKAFFGVF